MWQKARLLPSTTTGKSVWRCEVARIRLNAAPGEYVISTFPGGTYASASGTSFSSPMVAGTVALMLNAKNALNQASASSALSHAIKLTPDLHHGRLDIYQAVSAWVNSNSNSSSCSFLCL